MICTTRQRHETQPFPASWHKCPSAAAQLSPCHAKHTSQAGFTCHTMIRSYTTVNISIVIAAANSITLSTTLLAGTCMYHPQPATHHPHIIIMLPIKPWLTLYGRVCPTPPSTQQILAAATCTTGHRAVHVMCIGVPYSWWQYPVETGLHGTVQHPKGATTGHGMMTAVTLQCHAQTQPQQSQCTACKE